MKPVSLQRSLGAIPLRLALAILASSVGCDSASRQTAPAVRSVLLITIDTLRADHLSAYGYPLPTSPELDRFMARGTRYRWGFSTSSRTVPSHVSLLTGLYPSFTSVSVENGRYNLLPETPTLATLARQSGLRTAAVVSNQVLRRSLGLARGFETYDDALPETERNRRHLERTADHAVDTTLALLSRLGEERFFVWLHLQDPHGPYTPPQFALEALEAESAKGEVQATTGERDRRLPRGANHSGYGAIPIYQYLAGKDRVGDYIRLYDAEIRSLDRELGRLFAFLAETGRLDDTLVAITADHGEAIGEDGYYFAHGHGVGTDQTHVPLAFIGPGISASVLAGPASGVDVFATLAAALELEISAEIQGRSLLPELTGSAQSTPEHTTLDRVGFAESVTQRSTFDAKLYLRDNRHPVSDTAFWSAENRYTGAPRVPLESPQWQPLGSLEGEDENPEALRRASQQRLRSFSERADAADLALAPFRRSARDPSPEALERLRALGYAR